MLKPFFIWQNKLLKRVDPRKVMFLVTVKNYTEITLSDNSVYSVRSSLSRAIKKLPPDMFIKIHRSLVVSIYYIDDIDRDHLIIAGEPIPIGKGFYKKAISQLNIME
jgi:DNA-binding LytR/AlgR family response regulator